ncbi:hypothetical protein K491DRAFT_521630 [Lophiostoma macrostomum CBS 122681]|uniref:Zn(2)-C6 fungal-type domain-containing protein n=1 Tax=Lophiostoma macrostomum CBS 122681 TaxID=1314788 RepID=A0A6A6SZW8_9PLEO|nr:hypothetical protein K491DRAFT_521630 [Lophiostoma macrostomum CBS 122681]
MLSIEDLSSFFAQVDPYGKCSVRYSGAVMKRFHHKTRSGCDHCRRRRIKCDEGRPSCTNCVRKQLSCNLDFLTPTRPGEQAPHHEIVSLKSFQVHGRLRSYQTVSLPRADAFLSVSPVDPDSTELLHHYTSVAYERLGGKPSQNSWRVEMPRLAVGHEMVMHGLLAVSAVHLATLQPDRSDMLRRKAALSESRAIPYFRKLTSSSQSMSPEDTHAWMAFAGFMPLYLLAQSRWLGADAGRLPSHTSTRPHWFLFFRSGLKMFRHGFKQDVFASGPLAKVVPVISTAEFDYSPSPDEAHLRALYPLLGPVLTSTPEDLQNLTVCRVALDDLRRVSALPYSPCKTLEQTATFYLWPGTVSDEYMQLLSARHREALIVLAGYCRVLKTSERRDVWMLEGVGTAMLRHIEEKIGSDWRGGMEWEL